MQPTKTKIQLLILLYISAMYNLRYYLTVLFYPEIRQTISQLTEEYERWPLLLAIYLPIALCVGLCVVFVRYLSPVFMKSSNTIVRVLFVLWAAVTLFFPLAVNKVYFTLPFAVGYSVVYLLLSWAMVSLERVKGK
ncbi:MAG: hypothetical protein EOM44_14215 [Bacteroidia bacterium]|nr:hypothetical protein [Bacteroidia bacterium]